MLPVARSTFLADSLTDLLGVATCLPLGEAVKRVDRECFELTPQNTRDAGLGLA